MCLKRGILILLHSYEKSLSLLGIVNENNILLSTFLFPHQILNKGILYDG